MLNHASLTDEIGSFSDAEVKTSSSSRKMDEVSDFPSMLTSSESILISIANGSIKSPISFCFSFNGCPSGRLRSAVVIASICPVSVLVKNTSKEVEVIEY